MIDIMTLIDLALVDLDSRFDPTVMDSMKTVIEEVGLAGLESMVFKPSSEERQRVFEAWKAAGIPNDMAIAMDDYQLDLLVEASALAVRLGFAMAKTIPTSGHFQTWPFEAWLQRSLVEANLDEYLLDIRCQPRR